MLRLHTKEALMQTELGKQVNKRNFLKRKIFLSLID
jgi:hypothetical protein